MGIKSAISRRIQGELHQLATLPGYCFRPRKYSYAGREEIDDISKKLSRMIFANPTALRLMAKVKDIEHATIKDVAQELPEADLVQLYQSLADPARADVNLAVRLVRLQLLHGVGQNNFRADAPDAAVLDECIDEETADVLMESDEVTNECLEVVRKHNRPFEEQTKSS